MSWAKETYGMNGVYESAEVNLEGITNDLSLVLTRLSEIIDGSEEPKITELLFYLDATNCCLYLSGYESRKSKTVDNRMLVLEIEKLIEADDEDYDFDDLIERAINISLSTSIGRQLTSRFQIWIQDQIDDPKPIQ